METTDFCSYELSKRLKACGFDEPCDHFYNCHYNLNRYADTDRINRNTNGHHTPSCSAPTLAHAQKWLREKWLLHIGANPAIPTLKWQFYIDDLNQQINPYYGELMTRWDDDMQEKADERLYDSYEAALSAGIASALELIKKGE